MPFQNCIYDGHLEIHDGRPRRSDFIYLSFRYHLKVFNCEMEIHVLNPKVAQNHRSINSVDGKHNVLYINHIPSDF